MAKPSRSDLALNGGRPVRSGPLPSGARFGDDEMRELGKALAQNTLFAPKGSKAKAFAAAFANMHDAPGAIPVSSGTSAVHVAIGTLDLEPGAEVITSPVTDFGTIIGLLYQGLVPVFADLDPQSGLMTPATVEGVLSNRTAAVVAVHLAGNPCDMTGLSRLCATRSIGLVEDCAQAYLARHQGRLVGTFGRFGCFSTNDTKHISTGDGGLVLVNDSDDLPITSAFADKNYRRDLPSGMRDVSRLAPNARMGELQGAVGLAQLRRLPSIISRRLAFGDGLRAKLAQVPGVTPMPVAKGDDCAYWFFTFTLDLTTLQCTQVEFAAALTAEGVPAKAGYIEAPIYDTPMFREHSAFAGSNYPFSLGTMAVPDCPGAERYLRETIYVPVSEFFDEVLLGQFVEAIAKVAAVYS